MRFVEFEYNVSTERLNRYLAACNYDTRKAMTLYRLNLRLSQELFIVISCFEVAFRNSIDRLCIDMFGNNWLKDSIKNNGIFSDERLQITAACVNDAIRKSAPKYSHTNIIAQLGFGFWRYFFASAQYNATKRCLLKVFPFRPKSSKWQQLNAKFIFNLLAEINHLRNRIAHHEPICFVQSQNIKSTAYAREKYELLSRLFKWMDIDQASFLYGLDHTITFCDKIDCL